MITYIFIFFAKILEVSLTTIRTVFITRGEKLLAAVIGFFEVSIWLYVIGRVLSGIQEDPKKMVIYALGFACGNYIGCIIEDKLALGILTMNVIVGEKDSIELSRVLREQSIGVTIVEGEGIHSKRKILIIHAKRKRKNDIIKIIENTNISAVISINDTKTVYGGYGIKK
ncbi:DUF5698 domain-containing protein [Clostridium sp. MB40-C1]|uniref:DUF2179 domain-containing protein n=1 Tax=Clostridium sp. MB40-C1 TaxID=3070996 RepID=UPI0027E0468C|nr:DUF5698 domain-containing protein [Clostridium sp. MB40-C1]WMJ82153.1 DUF5698 domain-containing protein [Clostridium sp. MB40-C1]